MSERPIERWPGEHAGVPFLGDGCWDSEHPWRPDKTGLRPGADAPRDGTAIRLYLENGFPAPSTNLYRWGGCGDRDCWVNAEGFGLVDWPTMMWRPDRIEATGGER